MGLVDRSSKVQSAAMGLRARFLAPMLVIIVSLNAPVEAQEAKGLADRCSPTVVGSIVRPQQGKDVFKTLGTTPPVRGEFESTAEFEQRQAEIARKFPEDLVVAIGMENRFYGSSGRYGGYVQYDADQQAYMFNSSFIAGSDVSSSEVGEFDNLNRRVGAQKTLTLVGKYRASNAFGVSANVSKWLEEEYIFADEGKPLDDWPNGNIGAATLRLPMESVRARQLKDKLEFAMVVKPRAPFLAKVVRNFLPEVGNPTERKLVSYLMAASIKCALVLDDKKAVLAVWPLRSD